MDFKNLSLEEKKLKMCEILEDAHKQNLIWRRYAAMHNIDEVALNGLYRKWVCPTTNIPLYEEHLNVFKGMIEGGYDQRSYCSSNNVNPTTYGVYYSHFLFLRSFIKYYTDNNYTFEIPDHVRNAVEKLPEQDKIQRHQQLGLTKSNKRLDYNKSQKKEFGFKKLEKKESHNDSPELEQKSAPVQNNDLEMLIKDGIKVVIPSHVPPEKIIKIIELIRSI